MIKVTKRLRLRDTGFSLISLLKRKTSQTRFSLFYKKSRKYRDIVPLSVYMPYRTVRSGEGETCVFKLKG